MLISTLLKGYLNKVIDKATDKALRYIVSCVIRCSKRPFEHKKWCKANPKAMDFVDTICSKAMEAKKAKGERSEHTHKEKGEHSEPDKV